MRPIELGDIARDTITGFQGVVIADTKWIHGCRRLAIQPKELKDGKPMDHVSFDEPQLVLVEPHVARTTTGTGGPRPEPERHVGP